MTDYTQTTLKSGLIAASERLPGIETVSIAVTVDVGARHEQEKDSGISHMLEHMAFKGTEKRTARRIAEEFDDIGGHLNAYTSMENTVYYARVLKDDVEVAMDILGDILQHSVFDKEELERERGVILQEIAMHHDTPDDLVFDYFHEAAFPNQPLGRSILGTPDHVSSFVRDDLKRYMGTHYHPKRMVVSAAGNIDHSRFSQLVEQHFVLPAVSAESHELKAQYQGGGNVKQRELEQLHVVLGWAGLSVHDKDYYAMQMLSIILGGGMSSRLFQEIREKRGLAYTVQSFASGFRDSGLFGVYAACNEDKAGELVPVMSEEIIAMCKGITEAELRRAKNQQKASILMMRESPASVSEWIGRHLLVYGKYLTSDVIMKRIDAITQEDVVRVAERVFKGSAVTVTALGPSSQMESYEITAKRFN